MEEVGSACLEPQNLFKSECLKNANEIEKLNVILRNHLFLRYLQLLKIKGFFWKKIE